MDKAQATELSESIETETDVEGETVVTLDAGLDKLKELIKGEAPRFCDCCDIRKLPRLEPFKQDAVKYDERIEMGRQLDTEYNKYLATCDLRYWQHGASISRGLQVLQKIHKRLNLFVAKLEALGEFTEESYSDIYAYGAIVIGHVTIFSFIGSDPQPYKAHVNLRTWFNDNYWDTFHICKGFTQNQFRADMNKLLETLCNKYKYCLDTWYKYLPEYKQEYGQRLEMFKKVRILYEAYVGE